MQKRLFAISVARSDFGRMADFYEHLHDASDFSIELIVGAAHFNDKLGNSLEECTFCPMVAHYPSILLHLS